METQSGTRTPLVDPFGREVEEWLRDAPATRTPYLADLVVPPVTGPVQRPDLLVDAPAVAPETTATAAPDEAPASAPADDASAPADDASAPADDAAFRRPRDHGRHRSLCAPSFPEPPERLALRLEELAVEVSAQSGRATLERIVVLEDEVRRRDEDLARLHAWEAAVADLTDPEVDAARAYARSVFEDLLADAADEADRRDRAAARRAATTGAVTVVAPAPTPVPRSAPALVLPVAAPVAATGTAALDDADADRDEPARLVPSLLAVTPVSANTRPTPLVSPATGPTVIDRDAFAAVLRAHRAESDATADTANTPVVFPEEHAAALDSAPTAADTATDAPARPGWWARVVAAVLRAVGRR
ncbi:hypothetical protein BIU98_03185 [Curtobacterium sp. MMLR14_010]|uniref:hypothetical protein n=1 Tax=Curtobacterium sp. MMLR14_010 TaxID=1898743 RepID=UPI0008DE93B6|nr:hypothetical protein [Curtobacterium sp. MMLR14_010]OII34966.1 hypothetical protein BIU98_03185 [Curtobacterium sp. MMLR14_010]